MLEGIDVLCHSSIRINKDKIIYIDPFKINKNYNDADIIFITHDHYDHYSEEDIIKVRKKDTFIIIPESLIQKAINNGFTKEKIISVVPNKKYTVLGIEFETVPSYNINKKFHPKENNWVGYILELNKVRYYIAGDTDITDENRKVICDIAFLPIGGIYTMTYEQAAYLANEIKPKIVVPIHYGEIVGSKNDAIEFAKLIDDEIQCKILLK